MKERCVGALHAPLGDCLRPVVGGLVCYGYLDADEDVPLEDALEGPVPLLFPSCDVHRAPLAQWAEHLWGDVADAFWVPVEGFARVKRFFRMERDPIRVSPDPRSAVGIAV